jgi:hypothetical protein
MANEQTTDSNDFKNYIMAENCLRHRVIDLHNKLYPGRHKIRMLSGEYSNQVAKRRKGFALYVPVSNIEDRIQARLLVRLGRVSRAGDVRAFLNTLQKMKWEQRPAEDFVHAIKLALNVSAPTSAQFIYDEGVKRHPESLELKRYARLFAPARPSIRTSPPNPTLKANREWLKLHRAEHRGEWIALRNGELLATGSSLEDLTRRVTDPTNVLLTRA